tara:strand:+ start:24 stop:200 length:177 start_codon:yes stop_codon:yes gene_type:complete
MGRLHGTGVLVVAPDYFTLKVENIKADFTKAIGSWQSVPPIVILFYGCVPVVIEIGSK